MRRRDYATERLAEERAQQARAAAQARRMRLTLFGGGLAVLLVLAFAAWLVWSPKSSSTAPSRAPASIGPVAATRPVLPAAGPAACRSGEIDPLVRAVPSEILALRPGPVEPFLTKLVAFLLAGGGDEFTKAKRLHDWLADNIAYDVDGYLGRAPKATGLDGVLHSGRSVCQGYADLFTEMCRLAGLQAKTITGHGRGGPFNPFAENITPPDGHAWNAVRLDDQWHLVDVTWDAGPVRGDHFVKEYTTDYLYLPADAFAYSHFPADAANQFLTPGLTPELFLARPHLRGGFFTHGLQLDAHPRQLATIAGEAELVLQVPQWSEFSADLEDPSDGSVYDEAVLAQWSGATASLRVRFPRQGRWLLRIFAAAAPADKLTGVAELALQATAAGTAKFPQVFPLYHERRIGLVEPLQSPLPVDDAVRFRVRAPLGSVLAIRTSGRMFPLSPDGNDGEFAGTAPVAADQVVSIVVKQADGDWATLVQYPASVVGRGP